MKTLYNSWLIFFCCVISLSAFGQQVPNSGFENWTMVNGVLEPDGWTTNNSEVSGWPAVTRSTMSSSGNYAMLIQPRPVGNSYIGEATTEIQLESIPAAVSFFWSTHIPENSSVMVRLDFFLGNTLMLYVLAGSTGSQGSYQERLISINDSSLQVDRVKIKISVEADSASSNASLLIDDFIFIQSTNVAQISASNIQIFPNPAKNTINIKGEKNIGKLRIFDVSGRMVLAQNYVNSEAQIDITSFTPGFYTLISEIGTQKLVIK